MGLLNLFNKKCCPCVGGAPSFKCSCTCHRIDDVEFWEPVAYSWICDASDDAAREEAWHRFGQAYPEHVKETCGQFWERIQKTRWHHKHHHEHHHKTDYC